MPILVPTFALFQCCLIRRKQIKVRPQ